MLSLMFAVAFAAPPAATPAPATPAPLRPATAADFGCLQDWAPVGHTRYASLNGSLDAALAVARGEQPGPFPAGTLVQLMPTEAMVKLAPGASPETDDWEYLKLKLDRKGVVTITERGGAEVKNVAGSCHGCHQTASQWDHVCAEDHGCKPLPGFIVKGALKAVDKDPRCR
jgi:hypothetical protein